LGERVKGQGGKMAPKNVCTYELKSLLLVWCVCLFMWLVIAVFQLSIFFFILYI
jgi:hypothetical protein